MKSLSLPNPHKIQPKSTTLGRVLEIEKNTLKFRKSEDKRELNSHNTLVPNIFLKISENLRFGRDYLY
jgi:hypothetical protein